jgi:phosphate acetyltransferase
MTQNLYIAGAEPRSGKNIVALGMMDLLTACSERVGFFRPVVSARAARDQTIRLVAGRYNLTVPEEAMFGCTEAEAWRLISQGKDNALLGRILERFKALEESCDLVVCLGTDYTGAATGFEFQFDREVANNLGCSMMPVVNGHGRSVLELTQGTGRLIESLREARSDVLAGVVNRVAPAQREELYTTLAAAFDHETPWYVVPEHPVLGMPTVGEIARALDAERLRGDAESLNREVQHYKVAAMELPHFLDHFEDGSLIITPGDRADIVLGSFMAHLSHAYPRIAGVLVTGGLRPAAQVERLLNGLEGTEVPVLMVATDTFATAMNVSAIEPAFVPENERKVAAALGLLETHLDGEAIKARIALPRPTRVTPVMFEYELISRAKQLRRHIVLPEGTDERILRAAEVLRLRDVVDLTILGEPEGILGKIESLGLGGLEDVPVVDPQTAPIREEFADLYFERRRHKGISREWACDAMADVSYFGTMMVLTGRAHGMVSGAVHTTQHTIRPAFEVIKTQPGTRIVSSVFFMCLPDRVLVYGDCAVNPDPDAEQLADIAVRSAETAARLGVDPRVAMLSYSTGASGKGAAVDKVRRATEIARELRPDLKIEGPIQYDAAVDAAVARTKLPESEVAGRATVFIFPDLNTGNNTYKAVQRSAGAVAIGPVLQGLRKPVNDLSRGCTVTDIVNTVAITAIQAQDDKG